MFFEGPALKETSNSTRQRQVFQVFQVFHLRLFVNFASLQVDRTGIPEENTSKNINSAWHFLQLFTNTECSWAQGPGVPLIRSTFRCASSWTPKSTILAVPFLQCFRFCSAKSDLGVDQKLLVKPGFSMVFQGFSKVFYGFSMIFYGFLKGGF